MTRPIHFTRAGANFTGCGIYKPSKSLATTFNPLAVSCERCMPFDVVTVLDRRLRLLRIEAERCAIIDASTGVQLGCIRRRDSWRIHDWFAELAIGDVYLNASEETLGDAFERFPYRARDRLYCITKERREEMKRCAERLRRDLGATTSQ